jgi:trans-feruloyl-CoA hydratase/vanillin synthase
MSGKTSTEKTSTEKVPGGKNVLVEFEDQIAWVTLNRPEKRNCMSPALNDEMVEVLDALELNDRCGVLVLTGAGDSFSAGMDLREFFRATDGMPFNKQMRVRRSAANWQWRQLMNFPKPTIAMVNGWCFGGAFTPLVSCDIAIAADEATFGLSEINWGIIPGGVVTRAVVGSMNVRNAMYHILTGIPFDGKKAAEMGLSTRPYQRRSSARARSSWRSCCWGRIPTRCGLASRPCVPSRECHTSCPPTILPPSPRSSNFMTTRKAATTA